MATELQVQEFRKSLRGPSFCQGDPGYDTARTLPNAMIDRRPAIIARCTGAADVIACVRFAREHDVVVSVRGSGHSVAGKSICDGGLMIDLSAMKGICIDLARRTARAEAGLKLGEFDRETQAFGWPLLWAPFRPPASPASRWPRASDILWPSTVLR
jgi:FAD/FMN-containing dehydrogenase